MSDRVYHIIDISRCTHSPPKPWTSKAKLYMQTAYNVYFPHFFLSKGWGCLTASLDFPQMRARGLCIWVPAVASTRSILSGNNDMLRWKIVGMSWSFDSRHFVTLSRPGRANIQVTTASMICGGLRICPRILYTHKLQYAPMLETSSQPSSPDARCPSSHYFDV